MTTIKLKVSDKILDKVLGLLSQFNGEDLLIIKNDENFIQNQEILVKELERVELGIGKTYSMDQTDDILEKVINKYES
jgi:hypothetical protein